MSAEQIELLNRSSRWGAGVGILSLPIVGAFLFGSNWPWLFYVLAGVIAAVSLLLLVQAPKEPSAASLSKSTRRRVACTVVAVNFSVGTAWGLLLLAFLTPDIERVFALFCVVMTLLFTVSSGTASYLPAMYAFNVPMTLLFIVPSLLLPSPFGRMAAFAVLIMLGLMIVYAHKLQRVIVTSIRMRFENQELNEALTEQRVQERTRILEAASRHKSEFLANMSHELRTPLNAILGYSEMLQEDASQQGAETLLPDLRKINSAGKYLLEMINSVLDLSKIEAGRMELHVEDFDVDELVGGLQEVVEPLAHRNRNQFEVRTIGTLGLLYADRTKLRQVLLNLLGNACKFTHDGKVILTIEREGSGEPGTIRFSIADTGIGIARDQLDRLFHDFAQANSSESRRYEGTGLGLALSRRLCRLMGGEISVQSQPGVGSTFAAVIPAPPHRSDDTRDDVLVGPRHPAGTVLVIDDDAMVRDLLQRFLVKDGFRVLTAASGEQGLALARECRPDVITLDIMLPGMDGWTVLSMLTADPSLSGIPVIILSMLDDRKTGYALGASGYLTKPIDHERLVKALHGYRRDRPVLVIDDDEMIRTLLRRVLEAEGHRVFEAADGRAALQQMEGDTPGMILLDLLMPTMDGFEFLAHIRQEPKWHEIPVLIVTAKDMTAEDRARLNGSVVRVLQKYVTGHERLLADVRSLVASSLVARRRGEA